MQLLVEEENDLFSDDILNCIGISRDGRDKLMCRNYRRIGIEEADIMS